MQIFCMLSSQLHMLNDLDKNFLSTLFKGCSVAKVIFHLRTRRRPLEPVRSVFCFFDGEGGMNGADYWYFRSNHPSHDAAGLFTDSFDTGHKIRKITELAEKFAGLFQSGPQFHLICVRGFDSKHLFSVYLF